MWKKAEVKKLHAKKLIKKLNANFVKHMQTYKQTPLKGIILTCTANTN